MGFTAVEESIGKMNTKTFWLATVASIHLIPGCRGPIEGTDRQVYQVIEERHRAALGETHDATLGSESGTFESSSRMYDFNPRPLAPGVPQGFESIQETPEPAADTSQEASAEPVEKARDEISQSIFSAEEQERVTVFSLRDALAYAMRHARDFQDAKEDLYLAALDLSLERHLWTPQLVASVQATYEDFPKEAVVDRALSTVSEAAVTQRLPFGGEVSARVIHALVREIQERVGRSESGQVILDASLPLLRGAGRVAYESRYLAEREMIYAVRRFERFRRTFIVDVAQVYFDLQQSKAAIANTNKSYLSQKLQSEEADFKLDMARIDIFQASRAKSSFRRATASLISAKQRYESGLDRFKIRLGMSVDALLDVLDQDRDESASAVDRLLPEVELAEALDVALRLRLDLLNDADRVDDARRGVLIAKNRILPDLDIGGSVVMDSDPAQLRSTQIHNERMTWRGDVQWRLDDRKTERNAYRASMIALRRAERNHEELRDGVRAEVRRALRRVAEQDNLRRIEAISVVENELRLEAAIAHFKLGKKTNQDVVDTEDSLLIARNALAAAVAGYRAAILEFRRDTGTLRVSDDGAWENPDALRAPSGDSSDPGDGR